MTAPTLSVAEANELRAVYASPGWQAPGQGSGALRQVLLHYGLLIRTAPVTYEVTAKGRAWLERNP